MLRVLRPRAARSPLHWSRWFALSALLALVVSCIPPPSPLQRLTDSAYDLNTATRFGRMDIAIVYVKADRQLLFATRRGQWGQDVRILDVDFSGMRALSPDDVEVRITVTWRRINEMNIRQSVIRQHWQQTREDDWLLMDEDQVGGSVGIFVQPKDEDEGVASAASALEVDKPH